MVYGHPTTNTVRKVVQEGSTVSCWGVLTRCLSGPLCPTIEPTIGGLRPLHSLWLADQVSQLQARECSRRALGDPLTTPEVQNQGMVASAGLESFSKVCGCVSQGQRGFLTSPCVPYFIQTFQPVPYVVLMTRYILRTWCWWRLTLFQSSLRSDIPRSARWHVGQRHIVNQSHLSNPFWTKLQLNLERTANYLQKACFKRITTIVSRPK